MKTSQLYISAAFGLFILGSAFPFYLHQVLQPELPQLGQSPAYELTDSNGTDFSSRRLEDQTHLVSFFFTSCEGVCPALNGRLSALHRKFGQRLQIVSITVDPENDTPEKLHSYAARFKADTSSWHFLTGARDLIVEVMGKGFKLAGGEQAQLHSTRVVLVDKSGQIRGYYQGLADDEISALAEDLKRLL